MSFNAHLFICTQNRSEGQACGSNSAGAQVIRDQLKAECKRLWAKEVRVNTAGCLGYCEKGIVAVLYPSAKWYFNLTAEDIPKIIEDIKDLLQK
jgi:(2Fe-2S) ferredoxin